MEIATNPGDMDVDRWRPQVSLLGHLMGEIGYYFGEISPKFRKTDFDLLGLHMDNPSGPVWVYAEAAGLVVSTWEGEAKAKKIIALVRPRRHQAIPMRVGGEMYVTRDWKDWFTAASLAELRRLKWLI